MAQSMRALTLYLMSAIVLSCALAHSHPDFRDETLSERLSKVHLYSNPNRPLKMTVSKTLPKHTKVKCEQIDGLAGIHYRSCQVENLCFLIRPVRWFNINPESFVQDDGEYWVNVAGAPGFSVSSMMKNISYDPQAAIGADGAVLNISTPAMIFSRFIPGNFFHRIHEDFLPLILQIAAHEELHGDANQDPRLLVMADGSGADYHDSFYSLIGSVIHMDQFNAADLGSEATPKAICFTNAFVGVPTKSLWYHSGLDAMNYKAETLFPTSVIDHTLVILTDWVKSKLNMPSYDSASIAELYAAILDDSARAFSSADIPRLKLTVIRRERYRKIRNESALLDALRATFPMIEVAILSEDNQTSTVDVIKAAASSFAIIGVHGALLASAIFMPKGSMLVEIMPFAVSNTVMGYYKTLGNFPTLGLHYRGMMSAGGDEHGPWDQERVNCLDVLPPSYQQGVKSNSSIPNFPCCFNIFWHYRSGQDVEADIPFVIRSLKEMMQEEINQR